MTQQHDYSGYDPEDVENVRKWISFCADLIEVEPTENPRRIRFALRHLAQRANDQYATLAEGEQVHLDAAEIDEWELPETVADLFTALTGNILFNAHDGPLPAARVLDNTLTQIERRLT